MNDYQKQPPKDYKATMDYHGAQIKRAMEDKQEGIRLSSSGRDAVLIVTSKIGVEIENPTNERLKEDIIYWRNWLYQNVYKMTEDEYKNLNNPF